jgi:DNA-binding beta-propeller fold protein YncE
MILWTLCWAVMAAAAAPDSASVDSLPWRLSGVGLLAETGEQRGQVLDPAGLAVDAFGRCYVTDAALHRLQWFDRNGRLLGEAGSLGSDRGQMRRPGSVTPLGAARVAVLDRENRRVLTYDLFGRFLDAIDLTADAFVSKTGAIDPIALASDRGGALYIVDAARDRILALDFSGNLQRTIDRGGAGSVFRGLHGLAVTPRGELITAEAVGGRIQRFDLGGRPQASWSVPRSPNVKRSGALAVAVDDTGRVAVADESAGTVWVYDQNGVLMARLERLSAPRAVAFAPGGIVLVAEATPGRVRRFRLAPAPVAPAGTER